MQTYDAVVLAGGGGRRLGGVDKATLKIGRLPLLDRALQAVQGAHRVVVVGPARAVPHGVNGVRETPPGGGPVAALAAAVPALVSELVVVLACDMPFVTTATVERLVAACSDDRHTAVPVRSPVDGALLVDADGRRQYLAAAYRMPALTRALRALGPPEGQSMRSLVHRLTLTEVTTDAEQTLDVDTWDDVERSRALLEER
jgi:molybdopterin-guanine dinucleotide biosynthesis protein A